MWIRSLLSRQRHVLTLVSLTTVTCSLTALAEPAERVGYEPKVVTLIGKIVPQTFPGPPEYTSVAKGDEPEREWILHLRTPIEVDADKSSEQNKENEKNIREVQLVFLDGGKLKTPENKYKTWKPFTRKGVTVSATGTLFHALTGHHHTKILMNVEDLQRKN